MKKKMFKVCREKIYSEAIIENIIRRKYRDLAYDIDDLKTIPVQFNMLNEFENRTIIPISILNKLILSKEERQELSRCFKRKKPYKGYEPTEILVALKYVDNKINIDESLNNKLLKKGYKSFQKLGKFCLAKTYFTQVDEIYLPSFIINKIITNTDGFYNKFMKFSSFKNRCFYGIDQSIWQKGIVSYYEENCRNKIFTKDDLKRLFTILKSEDFSKEYLSYLYTDNEVTHSPLGKYKLSDSFKDKITKNIPKDFDEIEKLIYIYYQLCLNLSFDPYYLINMCYPSKIKEKYLASYESVTNIHDDVICIDFVKVFVSLLQELNYDVKIAGLNSFMDIFHQAVVVKFGDVEISFDPTYHVYNADICTLKLVGEARGINATAEEKKEATEVKNKIAKVEDYITNNEETNWLLFADIYDKLEIKKIRSLEDVDNFVNVINEALPTFKNLSEFDKLNLIRLLCKKCMTSLTSESLKDVKFSNIYRNNNDDIEVGTIIEFCLEEEILIYFYPMDGKISRITLDELDEIMNQKEYNYFSDHYEANRIGNKYDRHIVSRRRKK